MRVLPPRSSRSFLLDLLVTFVAGEDPEVPLFTVRDVTGDVAERVSTGALVPFVWDDPGPRSGLLLLADLARETGPSNDFFSVQPS